MAAATTVTSIQTAEDQVRRGYADLTLLYKANIDALLSANQALLIGFQAANAEMLAFLQNRIKDGLATSRQLAGCNSAQSAIEFQLDYAKAALQAYVDEFNKLGGLAGQVVNDAVAPLRKRVEAVTGAAPDHLAA